MKMICFGKAKWQLAYPNIKLTDAEKKELYERHNAELANYPTTKLPLQVRLFRHKSPVRLVDLSKGSLFMTNDGKICLKTGYRSETEAYEVGTGIVLYVLKYTIGNDPNEVMVYPFSV